ncbi:MAG: cyclase family protein [Nitrospinota bacterium]
MAGVPLDQLYHGGAIVDVSDVVGGWDLLLPEHVETKIKVREGDILIVHCGWRDFYSGEVRMRKPCSEVVGFRNCRRPQHPCALLNMGSRRCRLGGRTMLINSCSVLTTSPPHQYNGRTKHPRAP